MKERMVPEQEVSDAGEDLVRLAAAKDAQIAERDVLGNYMIGRMDEMRAEIAALTHDIEQALNSLTAEANALDKADEEIAALTEQRDELRRQNAEKADLLDRCIALFRKNGDYPTLTREIVAALTSAPQAALDAESSPSLPETPEA